MRGESLSVSSTSPREAYEDSKRPSGGLRQADESHFVYGACPLCGGEDSEKYCSTRDYNWQIPGEFSYVGCQDCGLVRQDPRPVREHIPSLYPPHYGTAVREPNQDPSAKISTAVHRYRASNIERSATVPGFIFDIGCGGGFFLEFMRQRGWRVGGVESAKEHVDYATDQLGLNNITRSAWPMETKLPVRADAVCMFHLLEHLLEPVEALARTKDFLAPGGVVVVETPNVESWPMRIFGQYCTQFDAPRHLSLFSQATLRQCAERAGLDVVETRTFSPTTMEYTESLRYLAQALGLRKYPDPSSSANGGSEREVARGSRSSSQKPLMRLLHTGERLFVRACNTAAQMTNHGCNLFLIARNK